MGKSKIDDLIPANDNSGLFGLDFDYKSSRLSILPCAWDATVSYASGSSKGPEAVLKASRQVDLFDLELGNLYNKGIYFDAELINETLLQNAETKGLVNNARNNNYKDDSCKKVNEASQKLNQIIYERTKKILKDGKLVALLGGDHSSPFGYIKAIQETLSKPITILHFDAHLDCRAGYEGFTYSHASIMYNVSKLPWIKKIVHVGIRDFCESEADFVKENSNSCFYDRQLFSLKASGMTWKEISKDIINEIKTDLVYISFDIDGLDPAFCPATGTPVAGGISYNEALYLIQKLNKKHQIVGFDLCEVAPWAINEWNENVGARLLYKLCLEFIASND